MSIDNPVGEPPRDPLKGYQKFDQEPEKPEPPPEKNVGLFTHLLNWASKILDHFTHKPSENVEELLVAFKDCLTILQYEDRSEDDHFLTHFSAVWTKLLNLRRKEFKDLIQAIQSYPPGQDFSLGYYLTERAGETWTPIPYRELIQKIHLDYTATPLPQWISEIDLLLSSPL